MGELKSSLGMTASASSLLVTSGLVLGVLVMRPWYDGFCFLVSFVLQSLVLVVLAMIPFALKLFASLFLVT